MKFVFFLVCCVISVSMNAQMRKVVFICEHGAAKSVIAADYFNKQAKQRSIPFEAVCRATAPDSTLNSATRAGLKRDNIKPNLSPKKISPGDTVNAERIILFTPLPTDFRTAVKTEDWSTLKNIDVDYTRRRNAIIEQINMLLDELEKQ
ncbi:hypothetical protein [Pseudochryseolinea flava]|nr:hypothetical protein [Pseudochryseolinea flava]